MTSQGPKAGRWAIFWALGQFGVQAVASLLSFFLIARVVGPTAYSDYVVGLVVTGLAQCFGLAIFREPVVQTGEITEFELASVAKLSALWSLTVASITCVATWAWFDFGRSATSIQYIVFLLAFRILLDGVTAVPLAGRARILDLRIQSLSGILGSLVTVGVVILSVRLNIGIVGLALGQAVGQLIQSVVSLYFCKFNWYIKEPFHVDFVRRLLPRSLSVVTWQVIDYVNGSLDRLFLSARMPSTQIGVYGFGKRLNDIVFETVGGGLGMVCLPTFARAAGDQDLLTKRFLYWIGCSAFFVLPLLAFLFLSGEDLVVALFGPKWGGAVPIYRVFLVLGVIQAFGVVQACLIRGLGRSGIWTKYLTIQAVGNVAVVFAFSGIDAFVLSVAIVVKTYAIWGYSVYLICNLLTLRPAIYLKAIFKPIAAALLAAGATWVALRQLLGFSGLNFIAFGIVLYLVMYLIISMVLNRDGLRDAAALLRGRGV